MLLVRLFSLVLASFWSASDEPYRYSDKTSSCTKPAVRREWRTLSVNERAEWISAVNCLAQLPHDPALTPSVDPAISQIPPVDPSSSFYDDIAYVHMDLSTQIHYTGFFLPWHRWYVHAFEESLKNRCGYTGVTPYWDWTKDAANFYESSWWKDSDPVSGLGGWGDPNNDFAIVDGGFSGLRPAYPLPHGIRRNFTLRPFDFPIPWFSNPSKIANETITADEVKSVVDNYVGDFKGFQVAWEWPQGSHGGVHLLIGGDMAGTCPKGSPPNCQQAPTWTANDPLFFLHHAMVDKIWYDWQHRHPLNGNSFFGGSVLTLESLEAFERYPNGAPPYLSLDSPMPVDGLFPEVTIGDVIDTTDGVLCYTYE